MEKINTRNDNGVKSSCYMYRTIKGEDYRQWISSRVPEIMKPFKKELRKSGIKCYEICGELFVKKSDLENPILQRITEDCICKFEDVE